MQTPAKLLRAAIDAARQKLNPPQPEPNYDIAVLRRDQSGKVIGLKTPDGDDVDVVLTEKDITGGISFTVENIAVAKDGAQIRVSKFTVSGFSFVGGVVSAPADGVWYVGVDLLTGKLITLPRLGHRGWVPVAKAVYVGGSVQSLSAIQPVLPKSRLPRTVKKILAGETISVLVMGSSLAEGGNGTTDWSGMLFNSLSKAADYRIPVTMSFKNYALGGTPNAYQLAQLGYAGRFLANDYQQAGFPANFFKQPPNGRSSMFTGVDLVVLTTLANGGEYRLQNIEAIVRLLRKQGIEVILTTDNPQGAAQIGGTGPYTFSSYDSITSAALYIDGPEVMRVADIYNCELADTAAYVVDATLRYPTANIYRDSIHMYSASPNGRKSAPAGGYEVYARSIRSLLSIDSVSYGTVETNYTFDSDVQGFYGYNGSASSVAVDTGRLAISKAAAVTVQWGGRSANLTPIKNGDTVRIRGTVTLNGQTPSVGLQGGGGGWASSTSPNLTSDGAFDLTVTAIRDASDSYVLFYGGNQNAAQGSTFYIDNVVITVNSSYESLAFETINGREYEAQRLAASRVVADLKTPGDAFVILPKDENRYVGNNTNKGSLGPHPLGANSFARRFSSAVGASEDLLTLVAGNQAAVAAMGVVGFSLIYYSVNGDPAVTFEVYKNNTLVKTMTINAQTISREIYLPVMTTAEWGRSSAEPDNGTIDIRVTSGTLRIAALLALTMDIEILPPEVATRIGTWSASRVTGGAPQMPGYATDTLNDYAFFKCPDTGRRVYWMISGKPNSKAVDTFSGRSITSAESTSGVNNIYTKGGHVGPGELHFIQLKATQSNTDQATNGYGLHFGGIVIVNDR